MNIFYAKYKKDQVFLVKWHDLNSNKTKRLIFDCYNDKWKEYDPEEYYIPAKDVTDTIDPMDLKMAGSYVSTFEKEVEFPSGIRREFLKMAFEKKVAKI